MKRARVLSVSFPKGGYGSVDENRGQMVAHLEQTADYEPDFVCFTEVARELGVPNEDEAWDGEPVPGETTSAIGEVARQIGTHVIVGMQERVAPDETYNAAVLIGRDGEIIGRYHKVQPTTNELNRGTSPGDRTRPRDVPGRQPGCGECYRGYVRSTSGVAGVPGAARSTG